MYRPSDFHVARVAYIDATNQFNPTLKGRPIPGVPPGFVISRGLDPDPTWTIKQTVVGFSIARGQHGFGQLISQENPFLFVAVGDPKKDMDAQRIMEELKQAHEESVRSGLLSIDGFNAN
jgi:hypothetical protein